MVGINCGTCEIDKNNLPKTDRCRACVTYKELGNWVFRSKDLVEDPQLKKALKIRSKRLTIGNILAPGKGHPNCEICTSLLLVPKCTHCEPARFREGDRLAMCNTILANGREKKPYTKPAIVDEKSLDTNAKPVKIQIDMEGQEPLRLNFENEKRACHFIYHALYGVDVPFIQITNLVTGQCIRSSLKVTSDRARTNSLFDDFEGSESD